LDIKRFVDNHFRLDFEALSSFPIRGFRCARPVAGIGATLHSELFLARSGGQATEEVSMSAPLIGMSFPSFLVLLIVSVIAAAVVHWGFRYRLFNGADGFIGQCIVAWLGAWLGPAVLGHWFASAMLSNIYVIPALLGAFAGALAGTINAKILTGVMSQRGTSS
jgi:uncharacterized membrane protein YeaQ/YmgE (transglycosylase-associated protein family)